MKRPRMGILKSLFNAQKTFSNKSIENLSNNETMKSLKNLSKVAKSFSLKSFKSLANTEPRFACGGGAAV